MGIPFGETEDDRRIRACAILPGGAARDGMRHASGQSDGSLWEE